jgi:hypothetical protein
MDGYGYSEKLPDALKKTMENAFIFHGNQNIDDTLVDGRGIWAPLRPGHGVDFRSDGKNNYYSERFGVELSFADTWLKLNPGKKIAIIKYSRGGTNIDTAATKTFGTWEPNYIGRNGINQYDHFMQTLKNAEESKDVDGDGEKDSLILSGLIWMQGETDAFNTKEIAERYCTNLQKLMNRIRTELNQVDLALAIGMIADSKAGKKNPRLPFCDIVQEKQQQFSQDDRNCALVNSTLKYKFSDHYHFNNEGYIDLGKEFAEAIHKLNKNNWIYYKF